MDRRLVRFGVFELDRTTGELRRGGIRIRVQEQPLRILLELLERPGELVTRDELRTRIWGDTFVDYDHALNTAIKKLRSALGDSADTPRFIETIARRGYRFIAPVQDEVAPVTAPPPPRRNTRVLALTGAAVALAIVAVFLLLRTPSPRIDSLAVLPFVNLTGNPANEYVCDGLTETLISDLGHVRTLRVISRTTAMQYKSAKKPLPRIASELGVKGIVEGAVLRFGDRVRVNVKLVDASRDVLLWSSRYERDAADLDALRRELAVAVAAQFGARFDPSGWRSPDPDAQLLYLKGRYWLSQKNGAVAAQLFRQALAKDPMYAAPYAGLTEVEMFAPNVPPRDALLRARAFAEKAIALDGSVADAHASLGLVRMFLDRDFAAGEREFRRAIELKPGAVEAHHRYGQLLAVLGRFDESIAEARRAAELDPFSTLVLADYGRVLYFARRYDEAVAQYRRALAIEPNDRLAFWFLLQAYEAQKKYDLVVDGLRTTINPDRRDALDDAYRRGGYATIVKTWAEIVARDQQNAPFVRSVSVAARFAQAGDRERAFEWLERAYQSHTRDLVYLAVEPAFDPIRDDPRFAAMLKKIGLATSSSTR